MNMLKYYLLVLLSCGWVAAHAQAEDRGRSTVTSAAQPQQRTITGRVVDPSGQPLVGTTVQVINRVNQQTLTGTYTDASGNFSLSFTPQGEPALQITYIGYATQTLPITGEGTYNVTLAQSDQTLNEVVVIGYGEQSRRNVSGAISSIKGEQFENFPVASFDQAVQGQVAGVRINTASGQPGGGVNISVRGPSSISLSSQPLIVIDGIPIENQTLNQQAFGGQTTNALADINPNDIESIDFLKDAAAAAIYGSRAVNGVVIITTKRGRAGQMRFSVGAQVGVQGFSRDIEDFFLNTDEWIASQNEARANAAAQLGGVPALLRTPDTSTNWLNTITSDNPIIQNYSVTATGGTERTQFYASINYFNQEGMVKRNFFERLTLRSNIDHTVNDRIKFGTQIGLTRSINHRIAGDNSIFGAWPQALDARPDYPARDPVTGDFTVIPGVNNPLHLLEDRNVRTAYRILANGYLNVNILEGLTYRLTIGSDIQLNDEYNYSSSETLQGASSNGSGRQDNTTGTSWTIENNLNYDRLFLDDRLRLGATFVHTFQEFTVTSATVIGVDFPTPSLRYVNAAGLISGGTSSWTQNNIESYVGRVILTWDDRYQLQASARYDGTSIFPEDKYGWFPALSGFWRISGEPWMENVTAFQDLKLRASWGQTGNRGTATNFPARALFSPIGYNNQPGLVLATAANNDLTWETSEQINAGIDLSILEGRLQFTGDVYWQDTRDLILNRPLDPTTTGFLSVATNVGSVYKQGWEIGLNYNVLQQNDLTWSVRFNIGGYDADVRSLNPGQPEIFTGFVNIIRPGEDLGTFYVPRFTGIYQSDDQVPASLFAAGVRAGDARYEDIDGNGIINTSDRQVVGSGQPDFFGGFATEVRWKGFDLSMLFDFTYGNQVYVLWQENTPGNLASSQNAILRRAYEDRWTPSNTNTVWPRAINIASVNAYNNQRSSRWVQDGSYLRLRNLTLGYTLPASLTEQVGIQRARVYFLALNLFTVVADEFSGFDPEVTSTANDQNQPANDLGAIPQLRQLTLGIDISF